MLAVVSNTPLMYILFVNDGELFVDTQTIWYHVFNAMDWDVVIKFATRVISGNIIRELLEFEALG
jgi:hypothetical protein